MGYDTGIAAKQENPKTMAQDPQKELGEMGAKKRERFQTEEVDPKDL